MRWEGRRTSGNVEDRRGMSRGMVIGGGGGLATLVVLAIAMLTGVDPSEILQGSPSAEVGQQQGGTPPADDPQAQFVSVILADTEDTWPRLLCSQLGRATQEPPLVLFSDAVESACGFASAAVGPFYCPRDSSVYLDLAFFERAASAASARPATSRRPTSSPTRWATTCRTCSASPSAGARSAGAERRRRGATRSPCGSSCRPTASPACGRTTPSSRAQLLESGDIEEGLRRRGRHRRRHAAAAGAGPRRARVLHPRLLGAARAVVPPRPRQRRPARLRHLQRVGASAGASLQSVRKRSGAGALRALQNRCSALVSASRVGSIPMRFRQAP